MDSKQGRNLPGMPLRKPVPPTISEQTSASKGSKSSKITRWNAPPNYFVAGVALATAAFSWPLRWIVSGAPLLVYVILLGQQQGHRVLPFLPTWTIFSTVNLIYAIASTSWLLYWVFAAVCYPSIALICLFQFDKASDLARRLLRKTLLRDLHFIKDQIAFFDLPALEIDTDVNGLMVIRGVTLSLSSLTLVAHGVEAGIKMSDDIELAIQTEKVTVRLFRSIEIDDVYANVKGGEVEMTFGSLAPHTNATDDDQFLVTDTPLLRTATAALDATVAAPVKMKAAMTGDRAPEDSQDTGEALGTITQISPDEKDANKKYNDMIRFIGETSTVGTAKEALSKMTPNEEDGSNLDPKNVNDLRAAICATIHDQPSIPHPPKRSIRVSTLRKQSFPNFSRFLHRFPLLYRLMLNPICYFHPVTFNSITAASSGKWFVSLMRQYLFKHYSTQDQEIRKLESRISAWLADANFAAQLGTMHATAQFPVNTQYDIDCHFKVADVMAYRTLPEVVNLTQVVRLGGGDATISIPTYLFPHHEHIMPPILTDYDELEMKQTVEETKGTPKEVQAEAALDQLRKDEANMKVSAHAHLPAVFDQELLNFVAALVKATKVIESDKDFEEAKSLRQLKRVSTELSDSEVSSIRSAASMDSPDTDGKRFKSLLRKVDSGFKEAGTNMRDGMRKAGASTVSAMANDRWIAKLVGKVMRKLERAQGEVGYSANVSISMQKHRERAESEPKILP